MKIKSILFAISALLLASCRQSGDWFESDLSLKRKNTIADSLKKEINILENKINSEIYFFEQKNINYTYMIDIKNLFKSDQFNVMINNNDSSLNLKLIEMFKQINNNSMNKNVKKEVETESPSGSASPVSSVVLLVNGSEVKFGNCLYIESEKIVSVFYYNCKKDSKLEYYFDDVLITKYNIDSKSGSIVLDISKISKSGKIKIIMNDKNKLQVPVCIATPQS